MQIIEQWGSRFSSHNFRPLRSSHITQASHVNLNPQPERLESRRRINSWKLSLGVLSSVFPSNPWPILLDPVFVSILSLSFTLDARYVHCGCYLLAKYDPLLHDL